MVDTWGGWSLFQKLLNLLKKIADKHKVSISNVAVRYILEQPSVAGAIVGATLSISENLQDNSRVFHFNLDVEDYQQIDNLSRESRNLFKIIGDCGDEYRR
ncbi:aldo/keto reductase [Okeania sp. SIO2G4]|uniref:aldo/keto reductase n=1 Tax=unclassified Okeania TaxID=2634635 RepID=UPI0026D1B88D